jgi:hypothetical protein
MKPWHANKGITSMQVGVAIALILLLSFLVVFLVRHEDANRFQSALGVALKLTPPQFTRQRSWPGPVLAGDRADGLQ